MVRSCSIVDGEIMQNEISSMWRLTQVQNQENLEQRRKKTITSRYIAMIVGRDETVPPQGASTGKLQYIKR